MKRGNAEPAGDLWGVVCGTKGIPIMRKVSKGKTSGHLKKMYCLTCGYEHNFVEVKGCHYTYDDFKLEYDYGNFNSEGDRILPYGEFKNKLYKEGVLE